jgi:DNA-binding CsgD family transcriptional regulator
MTMQPRNLIYIFSENYYLWVGIRISLSWLLPSRPLFTWISAPSLSALDGLGKQPGKDLRRVLVAEADQVETLKLLVPKDVRVLPDNLPLTELLAQINAPAENKRRGTHLTRSEWQVCLSISRGVTAQEMARKLNKSPKTINGHKRNAMQKMRCHSNADLWSRITQFV